MNLRLTIFAIAAAVLAGPVGTYGQEPYVWQPTVYDSAPSQAQQSGGPTGGQTHTRFATVQQAPPTDSNAKGVAVTVSDRESAPIGTPSISPDCAWEECGGECGGVCGGGSGYAKNGCSLGCHCPQCTGRVVGPDWGSIEFMHVWSKGRALPPLATTSPPGTPIGIPNPAGSLPVSTVLFGGERIGDDRQSAGRVDFGKWLDSYDNIGVGLRLWGLEGDDTRFTRTSNGDPILGIPFFNALNGFEDAQLVAFPGTFSGSLDIQTSNDILSAETYLRFMMTRGRGYRMDLIGGYHYNRIDDGIVIHSDVTAGPGAPGLAAGTRFNVLDAFDAQNDFHGGVLGVNSEMRRGCWSLRSLAKVSFGNMHETVTIDGSTEIVVPAPGGDVTVTQDNGLFAQQTNIGVFERDEFTYIPEVNLTLGYQVTDHFELTVGYTFVYWANVVLAGDQIDRNLNLSQSGGGNLTGPAQPEFTFRDTDYWVQGVNLGLMYSY